MTPDERAQVLREEAEAIVTDDRYGLIARLVTAAILTARADRITRKDPA